jgi:acyl carrier protein
MLNKKIINEISDLLEIKNNIKKKITTLDSLATLKLMEYLASKHKIDISLSKIEKINTIEDILSLIEKKND